MAIFIETVALIALTLLAIERILEKKVFKYKGAIHPRLREARLYAPLTPNFCKRGNGNCRNNFRSAKKYTIQRVKVFRENRMSATFRSEKSQVNRGVLGWVGLCQNLFVYPVKSCTRSVSITSCVPKAKHFMRRKRAMIVLISGGVYRNVLCSIIGTP